MTSFTLWPRMSALARLGWGSLGQGGWPCAQCPVRQRGPQGLHEGRGAETKEGARSQDGAPTIRAPNPLQVGQQLSCPHACAAPGKPSCPLARPTPNPTQESPQQNKRERERDLFLNAHILFLLTFSCVFLSTF